MNPFNKLYSRKGTTVPKVPLYLDIEFTNYCNLKCKMCGTNYSNRPKGYMDDKTIKSIMTYLLLNPSTLVRVIGWGEPTKHPDYNKYIQALRSLTYVHLNSNGYKDIGRVNSVKISVHGQKIKSKILPDYLTYTTTDLEFKKNWPVNGVVIVNKTDTRWIDGKNRSNKRFNRCGEVFDKLTIFWNGDITSCCGDVEGKLILGNINKDDLLDVWNNNKKLNYMRKELRKKNWNCTELCKICYDYTT